MTPLAALASAGPSLAHRTPLDQATSSVPPQSQPRATTGDAPCPAVLVDTRSRASGTHCDTLRPSLPTPPAHTHAHTHPTLASRLHPPPPLRCTSVQSSAWKPDTPTPLSPASARRSPLLTSFPHTRAETLLPQTPHSENTPHPTRGRAHTRTLPGPPRAPTSSALSGLRRQLWLWVALGSATKVCPGRLSTPPRNPRSHFPSRERQAGTWFFLSFSSLIETHPPFRRRPRPKAPPRARTAGSPRTWEALGATKGGPEAAAARAGHRSLPAPHEEGVGLT